MARVCRAQIRKQILVDLRIAHSTHPFSRGRCQLSWLGLLRNGNPFLINATDVAEDVFENVADMIEEPSHRDLSC